MKNTVEQIRHRIESLTPFERFFFEKVVLEYDQELKNPEYIFDFLKCDKYMRLIYDQRNIFDFINQIVYFEKERPLFMTRAMSEQVFEILSNETQALRCLIHG